MAERKTSRERRALSVRSSPSYYYYYDDYYWRHDDPSYARPPEKVETKNKNKNTNGFKLLCHKHTQIKKENSI